MDLSGHRVGLQHRETSSVELVQAQDGSMVPSYTGPTGYSYINNETAATMGDVAGTPQPAVCMNEERLGATVRPCAETSPATAPLPSGMYGDYFGVFLDIQFADEGNEFLSDRISHEGSFLSVMPTFEAGGSSCSGEVEGPIVNASMYHPRTPPVSFPPSGQRDLASAFHVHHSPDKGTQLDLYMTRPLHLLPPLSRLIDPYQSLPYLPLISKTDLEPQQLLPSPDFCTNFPLSSIGTHDCIRAILVITRTSIVKFLPPPPPAPIQSKPRDFGVFLVAIPVAVQLELKSLCDRFGAVYPAQGDRHNGLRVRARFDLATRRPSGWKLFLDPRSNERRRTDPNFSLPDQMQSLEIREDGEMNIRGDPDDHLCEFRRCVVPYITKIDVAVVISHLTPYQDANNLIILVSQVWVYPYEAPTHTALTTVNPQSFSATVTHPPELHPPLPDGQGSWSTAGPNLPQSSFPATEAHGYPPESIPSSSPPHLGTDSQYYPPMEIPQRPTLAQHLPHFPSLSPPYTHPLRPLPSPHLRPLNRRGAISHLSPLVTRPTDLGNAQWETELAASHRHTSKHEPPLAAAATRSDLGYPRCRGSVDLSDQTRPSKLWSGAASWTPSPTSLQGGEAKVPYSDWDLPPLQVTEGTTNEWCKFRASSTKMTDGRLGLEANEARSASQDFLAAISKSLTLPPVQEGDYVTWGLAVARPGADASKTESPRVAQALGQVLRAYWHETRKMYVADINIKDATRGHMGVRREVPVSILRVVSRKNESEIGGIPKMSPALPPRASAVPPWPSREMRPRLYPPLPPPVPRLSHSEFSLRVPSGHPGALVFFWDTEATGLDVRADDITQIGCVCRLFENGSWTPVVDDQQTAQNQTGPDEFSRYVLTTRGIPAAVVSLTGITNSILLQQGKPLNEVLSDWGLWMMDIKNRYTGRPVWLVAHNGNRFDLPLLFHQEETKCHQRAGSFFRQVGADAVVDTVVLSRRLTWPGESTSRRSHKLQDLYTDVFSLSMTDIHDALGDVRGLAALMTQDPFLEAWKAAPIGWTFTEYLTAFEEARIESAMAALEDRPSVAPICDPKAEERRRIAALIASGRAESWHRQRATRQHQQWDVPITPSHGEPSEPPPAPRSHEMLPAITPKSDALHIVGTHSPPTSTLSSLGIISPPYHQLMQPPDLRPIHDGLGSLESGSACASVSGVPQEEQGRVQRADSGISHHDIASAQKLAAHRSRAPGGTSLTASQVQRIMHAHRKRSDDSTQHMRTEEADCMLIESSSSPLYPDVPPFSPPAGVLLHPHLPQENNPVEDADLGGSDVVGHYPRHAEFDRVDQQTAVDGDDEWHTCL